MLAVLFERELAIKPDSAHGVAVAADLLEWRRKATHVLLVASAIAYLPAIVVYFSTRGLPLGWPVELCSVTVYVAIVVGAFLRGADHRIKVWAVVVPAYLFAILGSAALPQGPFMRAQPFMLAVTTLVLIGPRAGRIATVIGAAITLFAPLLQTGWPALARLLIRGPITAPPLGGTFTQGICMTGLLVSIVLLLERYHHFLVRALGSAHLAAASLEREAAERIAAHNNLQREMEERRRLEREIARIADEERRHLGQDVHDGVCQQLTGALLRCQALEHRIERGQNVASEDLSVLSSLLEEAINEAHAVAKGLCPLEPNPASLAYALRTLAKRTHDATGVECDFATTGDVSVPDPTAAQHLYRIAQEALSNASRHAQASRIVVELQRCADELLLRVEDNGNGLPPELPSGGMGLRTMTYRSQIIEGEISVGPGTNGGTCVLCRVPRTACAASDDQTHRGREEA